MTIGLEYRLITQVCCHFVFFVLMIDYTQKLIRKFFKLTGSLAKQSITIQMTSIHSLLVIVLDSMTSLETKELL
jgi:galactitol-specific phosphotransferase system IIC component